MWFFDRRSTENIYPGQTLKNIMFLRKIEFHEMILWAKQMLSIALKIMLRDFWCVTVYFRWIPLRILDLWILSFTENIFKRRLGQTENKEKRRAKKRREDKKRRSKESRREEEKKRRKGRKRRTRRRREREREEREEGEKERRREGEKERRLLDHKSLECTNKLSFSPHSSIKYFLKIWKVWRRYFAS